MTWLNPELYKNIEKRTFIVNCAEFSKEEVERRLKEVMKSYKQNKKFIDPKEKKDEI